MRSAFSPSRSSSANHAKFVRQVRVVMSSREVLTESKAKGASWRDVFEQFAQRRMLSMLFLGFSAGLPFYLVFQTLSLWLRGAGIARSTIGMLSWVSLWYSIKFIWAPIVDRMPLPVLTRLLGRRRSWMLFAQVAIGIGLLNMSLADPKAALQPLVIWALVTAFFSATQDIALDAWRIETAGSDGQAAMVTAYQLGYRVALLLGASLVPILAGTFSWRVAYTVMGLLVGVGILTTLLSKEPQATLKANTLDSEERVINWLKERSHWPPLLKAAGTWFIGAVVCPFIDFFSRYGPVVATVVLLFMCSYRLTDFTMGSMTGSFYIDKGYTLIQVGTVVKSSGLTAAIIGVILAGIVVTKIGTLRSLILGSVMVMISNLGFSSLATIEGPDLLALGLVNAFDNLALAMHGTALVTFLSSLTSQRYTATQYALFSSLYALPGKLLEGFSGFVVDAIGYQAFFVYTASLSIPALLLLYWVNKGGVIKPKAIPAAA